MAAIQENIRTWFLQGKEEGATHMIVVCDTFDWTDYPVYVPPSLSVDSSIALMQKASMQKIMEVYNLAMDLDEQLNQVRVWNT